MKVLLIEDDPILLNMYKDEFINSTFEVITAGDGKAGILEAAKQKPDFILLDIMMPDMDGVTAFKHLREFPQTKDIPVAFLTVVPEGVPETIHEDEELLKGAVGYWRKDQYTPARVVAEVKKYLSQKAN